MSNDNKELMGYLEEKFAEGNGKVDTLSEQFQTLQTSVESFATGTKTNVEEIKAVNHRVSGHEDWIKQAAPKVGLEFKP